MENNEMANRTNDLIASLTYFRLLTSLSITQKNYNANLLEAEKVNANIFEKGITKTKNAIKQNNIERLDKEKAKTEAVIERFKKDCGENTIYQYGESKEELKKELEDFLKDDHDDYIKYQLALTSIIDNRYKHEHENETLKVLSTVIFGNEDRLGEIKKMLSKNLRALLSDQKLEKTSKTVLITLGIAISATALITGGLAFAGAVTSRNIGQILANLGLQAAQKWGAGLIIATSSVAGIAALGGLIALTTTCAKDIYQDEKAYKEALRAMKPSDLSATLAIKLTLVELAKEKANKEKLKEYKEAVLTDADYIRSDCEFLYIIENSDERDSKTKASICNKVVAKLATI